MHCNLALKKSHLVCPGRVAQLVGAPSPSLEGCGFNPRSRLIPRLWVGSPVGVCVGGNPSTFLTPPGTSGHWDTAIPLGHL